VMPIEDESLALHLTASRRHAECRRPRDGGLCMNPGLILGAIAMTVWSIYNLAIAVDRPLPVGDGRARILFIFNALPEPWNVRIGALANAVLGFWILAYFGYKALAG
jgi:hypothetical protein